MWIYFFPLFLFGTYVWIWLYECTYSYTESIQAYHLYVSSIRLRWFFFLLNFFTRSLNDCCGTFWLWGGNMLAVLTELTFVPKCVRSFANIEEIEKRGDVMLFVIIGRIQCRFSLQCVIYNYTCTHTYTSTYDNPHI